MDNSIIKNKIIITSISQTNRTLNNYYIERNTKMNSELSFPKISYTFTSPSQRNNFNCLKTTYSDYRTLKKPKIELNLKKMELFIRPIYKSVLEKNGIKALKESLTKKKFNELHKYKLEINPKNYYHNYGLNNYIVITNNKKKKNYSSDYQYNNISSYNNIYIKKDEEKKMNMKLNKKKLYKDIKINNYKNNICLYKNVPFRIKNTKSNEYIINSFNEEKGLTNINSLWRGKNINDIIHNKTNLNFFRNFIKNSKNIGKLKIAE